MGYSEQGLQHLGIQLWKAYINCLSRIYPRLLFLQGAREIKVLGGSREVIGSVTWKLYIVLCTIVQLWSTWLLPLSFSPPEGLEDTQVSPRQGSSAPPSPHVLDAELPSHLPIHLSQQAHFYLGTHLSSIPPAQPTVQGKLTLPHFQVWAWLVEWCSHPLYQGLDNEWACDPIGTNEVWGEVLLRLLEEGFTFQGSSGSSWLSLPIAVLTHSLQRQTGCSLLASSLKRKPKHRGGHCWKAEEVNASVLFNL